MHHGPLWLVGAGNMGGAMLRGWLAAGLDPATVTVIDPQAGNLPGGIVALPAPPPDGAQPATLVLAVKPQLLDAVTPALAPIVAPETVLVSILAGVEIASLRRRFASRAVARVMPNTPVAVGKGVMAVHGVDVRRDAVAALLAPLGLVEWIEDEALFDAVTALSGCGPAFLFRFVDAMAKAGAALGLPADQAARLALATVDGAAALAVQADEPPAVLADRVASPGGSTREGMNRLDRDGDLDRLLAETLAAAARRNAEMAAAAR
ncbi:pyrroline-5-carboxylate reductase [Sphingomonas jatrophae]|uniref:pyrroline-5-carboxylate reductase n=1 Tax=Sphingomonas jatrophae TaxID=1166337 RepID=UPI000B86F86B|nr:pyrroline-5-carboxylate reductase [Sphingomonas jatrophae]